MGEEGLRRKEARRATRSWRGQEDGTEEEVMGWGRINKGGSMTLQTEMNVRMEGLVGRVCARRCSRTHGRRRGAMGCDIGCSGRGECRTHRQEGKTTSGLDLITRGPVRRWTERVKSDCSHQ